MDGALPIELTHEANWANAKRFLVDRVHSGSTTNKNRVTGRRSVIHTRLVQMAASRDAQPRVDLRSCPATACARRAEGRTACPAPERARPRRPRPARVQAWHR